MSKNLEVSVLLDFYGSALTEKQKDAIELYYNEDLSLAEIAEIEGITRQGVRDSIKRGEGIMFELEEKLGLAERFKRLQEGLEVIEQNAKVIEEYNNKFCFSREIAAAAGNILSVAGDLSE